MSKVKKMVTYHWADSIRRNTGPRPTAEVAHKEIERIRAKHKGRMKAEYLVDEARATKGSPFHKTFDWNVRRAARKHWLETARLIIRSVVVERVGSDPHHAYFQVREQKVRFYSPANEIMSNKSHARQLLAEAESYYLAGRSRYNEIVRLAKLHRVIDGTFRARRTA